MTTGRINQVALLIDITCPLEPIGLLGPRSIRQRESFISRDLIPSNIGPTPHARIILRIREHGRTPVDRYSHVIMSVTLCSGHGCRSIVSPLQPSRHKEERGDST